MTAAVIHYFPVRRSACVWLLRAREGTGWLVCALDHGWLHGDRRSALEDAQWLADCFGFPVREAA